MALFDYGEMANAIQKYQKISGEMDTLINDYRTIEKKINSDTYWMGEASNYYKNEMHNLLKNLEDIKIATKNISRYITRVEANHRKIDSF